MRFCVKLMESFINVSVFVEFFNDFKFFLKLFGVESAMTFEIFKINMIEVGVFLCACVMCVYHNKYV